MLNVNGSAYKLDNIIADASALKLDSTAIKSALFARTGVAPNLAAAINVTPAATAWKLGAAAAVIATGAIASAFELTGLNIEGVGTTSGDCQFIIYEGTAASSAVASVRARVSTAIGAGINGMHIPLITNEIAANKSIKIKVAALTTTVPVPAISVSYKIV